MCLLPFQRSLRVERMGLVPYVPMHVLQQARQKEVSEGLADDTLFLLEHPPVLTLGKNTTAGHVRAEPSLLKERGIEVIPTGRGGDVTYHGPGQLVGYPIIHMQEDEQDIRRFVTFLEETMIRTCHDFGIHAHRSEGLRGIWVGDDKIGAVGVRVARWTSLHGFALNITTHLQDFDLIVPCGIHGKGVTSMEKLLHRVPRMDEVQEAVVKHLCVVMDRKAYEATATSVGHEQ